MIEQKFDIAVNNAGPLNTVRVSAPATFTVLARLSHPADFPVETTVPKTA